MKRNILVFGVVSGLLLTCMMIYTSLQCYNNPYYTPNDGLGWVAIIAAFAGPMFIGMKNYRDRQLSGFIGFGKALKMGLLIALLAASMYVAVWLVEYYAFIPDFVDKYTQHVLYRAREDGAPAAQIKEKTAAMATFKELYKSPLFVVFQSYMEVLPVGALVALTCALILKRKPKMAL